MSPGSTRATIDRFNEAFNRHDADALAEVLTDDTVFEDTSPPPDGRRIEGKTAGRGISAAWTSSPYAAARSPRSSPTSKGDGYRVPTAGRAGQPATDRVRA